MKNKSIATFSSLSIHQLFLIDAIGALVSALMLGLILPGFHEYIGLPVIILRFLAAPAFIFFLYSTSCYFFSAKNRATLLQVIAFANLLYCLVTATLLLYHFDHLLLLGWIYFTGEIAIVFSLSRIEWKAAQNSQEDPFEAKINI